MTETHESAEHAGPAVQAYLVIFGALCAFTLISFVVNAILGQNSTSAAIILGVAVCKAGLVAAFFMHLKWDWRRFYFMIIPALVLGALLIVVLLPDMALFWLES